jgi:hypothetical protein
MKTLLMIMFVSVGLISNAQIREIPKAVEETFANQYPKAEHIDYKDQITKVNVHFILEGDKMMATYTNKGAWKGTEKEWAFDKLSEEVKDGFSKSKFANDSWEADETTVLYLPGGSEQYRVRVKKSGLQKKYLFFNTKGRLLRDAITI